MVAIVCVCMIVYTTGAVIPYVCDHDQRNSRDQQPGFISDKEELFRDEEYASDVKQNQRLKAVVVLFITVPK